MSAVSETGLASRAAAHASLVAARRLRPAEIAFWLMPIAGYFLFPDRLALLSEIAILGLFALSLDILLGFAGIVSLGHAAFFGLGAYTAGILGKYGWTEPLSGLAIAALVAGAVGFITSFLVLRGNDLTRLMVTLGVSLMLAEAANRLGWLTGGADGLTGVMIGPVFGVFEFDIFGVTAYWYAVGVLFVLFCLARYLASSVFGLTLRGIKGNSLRMAAIGAPVNLNLVTAYTIGAAYAGVAGGLLAQTTQFASLDVLEFQRSAEVLLVLLIGGSGYLYGGLIGAVLFKLMHDLLSDLTPQYWQFWLGILLVVLVLSSREGVRGLYLRVAARFARSRHPGRKGGAA
ncbi:branched-chain amino acid ABC transporter permease [Radicibacter daui]|uniref:branched-chain amino acid ABC transporter permease n=1 Tax=Radicibacter daui TaxID=3064829 RepID=UPI004046F04A